MRSAAYAPAASTHSPLFPKKEKEQNVGGANEEEIEEEILRRAAVVKVPPGTEKRLSLFCILGSLVPYEIGSTHAQHTEQSDRRSPANETTDAIRRLAPLTRQETGWFGQEPGQRSLCRCSCVNFAKEFESSA